MIDLRQMIIVAMKPPHVLYPADEHRAILFVNPLFDDAQSFLCFPQLLLQQHQLLGFLHVVELINRPVNRQAVALTFQRADQTVDPEEESFDPFVVG